MPRCAAVLFLWIQRAVGSATMFARQLHGCGAEYIMYLSCDAASWARDYWAFMPDKRWRLCGARL